MRPSVSRPNTPGPEAAATVGEALAAGRAALAAVSETPGLEAQRLLAETTGRDRAWLLAHPEAPVPPEALARYHRLLDRRQTGEPLPYILGWVEFYGRRFEVSPAALIPRPETETLVEAALSYLRARPEARRVVDVGAGSGCIAVTLAAEAPQVAVVATDVARPALDLARRNARRHGVERRVCLVQADLLAPFGGSFDLVCANLPYVPSGALEVLPVADWEPRRALDGGEDGLALVRPLLAQLPARLASGGQALLEIGADQGAGSVEAARTLLPGWRIRLLADLAGRDRVLVVERVESA